MTTTIFVARRRWGYKVYHRGHIADGSATYQRQSILPIGYIRYNIVREQYEFKPSIWILPILNHKQMQEIVDILKRLDKGESL